MITATISLVVPPLEDNEIAFVDAAAWNNYFNNLTGDVTIDPLTVTGYTAIPFDTGLPPYSLTVDSEEFVFPTLTQFNSLRDAYNALASNYQLLRNELYAGGLISTP